MLFRIVKDALLQTVGFQAVMRWSAECPAESPVFVTAFSGQPSRFFICGFLRGEISRANRSRNAVIPPASRTSGGIARLAGNSPFLHY